MRFKLHHFTEKLKNAITQAPVEIVVSTFYWIVIWLDIARITDIRQFGWTFPICFCMIYAINHWTCQKTYRWAYFASIIIVPLFWWWQPDPEHPSYIVALIISQLMIFLRQGCFTDEPYVRNVIHYIGDVLFALLIATLVWLLSLAIFYSITYIFEIWESLERHFTSYSSTIAFIFICPLLFVAFNIPRTREPLIVRFADLVVNYILTPALLIYTAILYVYFVKILVLWSLPKGGLSYMGISFIAILLIGKSVQPLLQKRIYHWFYGHYSWWTLPALVMLWISIIYRVSEYGLTEARVYLVLTAIFITLSTILFFTRHDRNYTPLTIVATGMLALFTYIPGLSANDLGVNSQVKRFKTAEKCLMALSPGEDSLRIIEGNVMYHSITYVHRAKTYHYRYQESDSLTREILGFANSQVMLDSLFTPAEQGKITNGRYYDNTIRCYFNGIDSLNIQGYRVLRKVYSYQRESIRYTFEEDSGLLRVYQNDSILVEFNVTEWLKQQIPLDANLTEEVLECNKNRLVSFDAGDTRVVLSRLQYNKDTKKVDDVDIDFILIK